MYSFVVNHYHEVEPYFALDPLLHAVFVALTPKAEFSLLCQRLPPFLTASWLTHSILEEKITNSEAVQIHNIIVIIAIILAASHII